MKQPLNRAIAPAVHDIRHIDILKAEKHHLPNGIPVHYIAAGSQEVVKIDFIFEAGNWQQPMRQLAAITNSMLQEGNAAHSANSIAERFDFCGSYLQLSTDQHFATISIICLNRHFPEMLHLAEAMIKSSHFPAHELEVLLDKRRQKFLQENEKVKTLCQKEFTRILFGNEHPYAITNQYQDFDLISRDHILRFYESWYHAGNCRIIMAGRITHDMLLLLENHFGGTDWHRLSTGTPSYIINPANSRFHQVLKSNTVQSAIRTGKLMPLKTHSDFIGLSILITVLGGYFGSRLMTNIREEKGYTYGIGAYMIALREAAYLVISTETANEYVQPVISEINLELQKLREEKVPQGELSTLKSYLTGEFLRDLDGPFALAGSFRAISDFGLDYDFYDQYLETIRSITPQQLQDLAQKYFLDDEFFTVVAGANP